MWPRDDGQRTVPPWGNPPTAPVYALGQTCKYNHGPQRDPNGKCSECRREGVRRYRKNHPERRRDADRKRYAMDATLAKAADHRRHAKHFLRIALRGAKKRAKDKGLPHDDVTEKELTIPKFCPLLGIELKITKGGHSNASPSIDRIIPELGYVRGNLWVISNRANRIKNDATVQELETLLCNLKQHMKSATSSLVATVAEPSLASKKMPWE